ncbi:MAG: hypothetical protein ACKVYV_10385 [Limisphaerales bacterium]
MSEANVPHLGKLPFLAADLTLLATAAALVAWGPRPFDLAVALALAACVALGAWLLVLPFLREHEAAVAREQRADLAGTLAQIQKLESAAMQIGQATASWAGVAERAAKSVESAAAIEARLSQEARAFGEILKKQNDGEKQTLRLETEKLRRAEGDWLQAAVRMLDHTYALFRAALQSGQESVVRQIGSFQLAQRDAARRMGLVALLAQPGEPFDERRHQLAEGAPKPGPGAVVADCPGAGYVFQGQLIRPPLVMVRTGPLPETAAPPAEPEPAEIPEPAGPPPTPPDDAAQRELL